MQAILVAATTAEVLAAVPDAIRRLTDAERERAGNLRSENDRDDFVAAHILARGCVTTLCQVPADRLTWRQQCPECGGPHGRPGVAEAPDLGISLAHAPEYVAAAAAPGPVGVDIEPAHRGHVDRDMEARVLSDSELRMLDAAPDRGVAFVRLWVRREALIKIGALTLDALSTVDLSGLSTGEPDEECTAHPWDGLILADWRFGNALGAIAASLPIRLRPLASVLPFR